MLSTRSHKEPSNALTTSQGSPLSGHVFTMSVSPVSFVVGFLRSQETRNRKAVVSVGAHSLQGPCCHVTEGGEVEWAAEAGRSPWVPEQPGIHGEILSQKNKNYKTKSTNEPVRH